MPDSAQGALAEFREIQGFTFVTVRRPGLGLFGRREPVSVVYADSTNQPVIVLDRVMADAIRQYYLPPGRYEIVATRLLYYPAKHIAFPEKMCHAPVQILDWDRYEEICVPGRQPFGLQKSAAT